MKGFISIFKSSAKELTDVRTITVTGMLLAVAIALRSFAIDITQDMRISFAFIAIMAIAVLYGPVVAGMANFAKDFIGYIISNHTTREYSIPLAMVVIISGIIYGLICYSANDDESEKYRITPKKTVKICISRVVVVLISQVCLNSIILYVSYVNKDFSFLNPDGYNAFFVWLTPRLIKNAVQLIVDIPLVAITVPLIVTAYNRVRNMYSAHSRKSAIKQK